ncbi:hypothetical protein BHYA_0304g00010 [Botrytis hyacinthi]|uniref:BTB domain-containing protein n=1 Tax=Botrytis hyacinthi TaxID=278943 RepID=A0A4Z1GF34_9HELO|nr:hypothetical protein BHYA_0304g00010 [Botrytis hyacinthi]
MTPDPESEVESTAEDRHISKLAGKDPNNEKSMSVYITVRSHVFEIPKDIAITASKLFARAWNANPRARSITFKVEEKDGDDIDPDPEQFYTVDAIAHLVGYMYGNELGCPASDVERHSGCLVAWCKVYKHAAYFEMEAACESALARMEKCLGERKFCPGIPTRKEVLEIDGMTREGSEVREALFDVMAKMGRLWDVVGEDHVGDTKIYVENWLRSSSVLREFQEAIWMRIGEGEEERVERIREARGGGGLCGMRD